MPLSRVCTSNCDGRRRMIDFKQKTAAGLCVGIIGCTRFDCERLYLRQREQSHIVVSRGRERLRLMRIASQSRLLDRLQGWKTLRTASKRGVATCDVSINDLKLVIHMYICT